MKLALVFSGQGAQTSGMGKSLYDNYSTAKAVFDKAGDEIKHYCFEGSEDELKRTDITQPCIYTVTIAALEVFKEKSGIDISAVAGFSLGEYAALTAAGVFTFGDGLELIKKRGKWMEEAGGGNGKMAAVLGDIQKLTDCLKTVKAKGVILPVNYNCPGQTVVAGENAPMDEFTRAAAEAGLKVIPLKVSGAFHSPLMSGVSVKIAAELENINLNEQQIPVYSNVTGEIMQDNIKELIGKQVKSPVLWEKTIRNMKDAGIDTIIEIGVGKTLCGLVRKTDKEIKTFNIDSYETMEAVAVALNN